MQNIVALYDTPRTAIEVVRQLQQIGIDEGHIDLIVDSAGETGVKVRATVKESVLNEATQTIHRHGPIRIDRHDLQWRRDVSHHSNLDERK